MKICIHYIGGKTLRIQAAKGMPSKNYRYIYTEVTTLRSEFSTNITSWKNKITVMNTLGRVKRKSSERVTSAELVLIPPSLEKQINTMDRKHPESKLLASKRIQPKSTNQPNSKNLYLNPTHLFLLQYLFLCLPMPSDNPSSIITIATHCFHLTFLEKSFRCRSH